MFDVKHMRHLKTLKSILYIESAYVAYVLANYTRAYEHNQNDLHVLKSTHMLMLSHAYTRTRKAGKHMRHMRGHCDTLIQQALSLAYVCLKTYASTSAKHMRGGLRSAIGSLRLESVRFKTFEL